MRFANQNIPSKMADAFEQFMSRDNGAVYNKPYIIYGAGIVGSHMLRAMLRAGIAPLAVWDKNADNIRQCEGIPVLPPDLAPPQNLREAHVLICLADTDEGQRVEFSLKEAGFKHILPYRDITRASGTDYGADYVHLRQALCERVTKDLHTPFGTADCTTCSTYTLCPLHFKRIADRMRREDEDFIRGYTVHRRIDHTSRFFTVLTTHCNLRCIGCGGLYPDPRCKPNVDSMIRFVRKYASATEYIFNMSVAGGEIMLFQRELLDLLKGLLPITNLYTITIVTNGTLPIQDELLEFIKRHTDRLSFSVDEYNVPGRPTAPFIETITAAKIPFHFIEVTEWYDFRDITYQSIPDEELRTRIKTCPFGQLHGMGISECGWVTARCGMQDSILRNMGSDSYRQYPSDTFNIDEIPLEQLADRMLDLHNNRSHYMMCRHCSGFFPIKSIPAGSQPEHITMGEYDSP